jgi:hypothetical protein
VHATTADTSQTPTVDSRSQTFHSCQRGRLPGVEAAFAATRDIKLLLFD